MIHVYKMYCFLVQILVKIVTLENSIKSSKIYDNKKRMHPVQKFYFPIFSSILLHFHFLIDAEVITLQTFLQWVSTLKASGHVDGTITDEHILHCLFGMPYPPVAEGSNTNEAQGESKGEEAVDATAEASSPSPSSPKGRSSPPKLSSTSLNPTSNRKSTFPPTPKTLSKELTEQLLYKSLNYVDFLHYICRIVGSAYWIHGSGDDNTRPNEPAIGVITTQVSSSTLVTDTTMANGQVLKKKLVAWLQELPAFGISFAQNNN
jgi:hypothetical protein